MNRSELRAAIRRYTRDTKSTLYTDTDLNAFINEAIYRTSSVSELASMVALTNDVTEVTYLPLKYQYLLGLYASSRAFSQDEQHYQASQLMNEFEYKMNELVQAIEDGSVTIVDSEGDPVVVASDANIEYVTDIYYAEDEAADIDDGVDD